MNSIEHIVFRSAINHCNYDCSYCPFSKNEKCSKTIEQDKVSFDNFYNFLNKQRFDDKLSILIAPYGEALVHQYVIDNLIRISKLNFVSTVSCQTNCSMNVKDFIFKLFENQVEFNKVSLWCSFHYECVEVEEFSKKVNYLSKYLSIVVVVIGHNNLKPYLEKLKLLLDESVAIRVNTFDGKSDNIDNEFFKSIDYTYISQRTYFKSDYGKCNAGSRAIFVDSKGNIYPCIRNKVRIGNYTSNELKQGKCSAKHCDCFLSYVNRKEYSKFGKNYYLRFINNLETVCFDIDGTLTNKNTISKVVLASLERLSMKYDLYFVTARSYDNVVKYFANVINIFRGGVFSNGGEVYFNDFKDKKTFPIEGYSGNGKLFYNDGCIVKVMSLHKENNHLSFSKDGNYYIYTKKGISKLTGLLELNFSENTTLVVGNSSNDFEMLKHFENSVAVNNSNLKGIKNIMSLNELLRILE